jgi:Cu2+-exporting ATPase
VSGVVNGTQYRVRQSTLEEMNPEFEHALQITLETDEGALISIALDDALRPDAKHTIEALQAMNIRLTILSGDREDRVQAIAQSLQIDHALAQCRPEDKLRHLRHISASTVMVGDGLNDSPVLAAANGSITFAQAADLTRLSAGAILLSPELKSVLKLRETAQKTTQVIRQSLFWVLVYNAIAVPFAMSGWVPPWLAAIGMSASSLFVITNALRLNRIS